MKRRFRLSSEAWMNNIKSTCPCFIWRLTLVNTIILCAGHRLIDILHRRTWRVSYKV